MKKITKVEVKKVGAVRPKKAKKPVAFDVFKANGMFVRRYEASVHGENAEQWAKNFTANTNMTYKPVFE